MAAKPLVIKQGMSSTTAGRGALSAACALPTRRPRPARTCHPQAAAIKSKIAFKCGIASLWSSPSASTTEKVDEAESAVYRPLATLNPAGTRLRLPCVCNAAA